MYEQLQAHTVHTVNCVFHNSISNTSFTKNSAGTSNLLPSIFSLYCITVWENWSLSLTFISVKHHLETKRKHMDKDIVPHTLPHYVQNYSLTLSECMIKIESEKSKCMKQNRYSGIWDLTLPSASTSAALRGHGNTFPSYSDFVLLSVCLTMLRLF